MHHDIKRVVSECAAKKESRDAIIAATIETAAFWTLRSARQHAWAWVVEVERKMDGCHEVLLEHIRKQDAKLAELEQIIALQESRR